jgi:integrase/recombinase XerD
VVKVLRSFVRGPLESHIAGFAEALLRRGYSRSSAEQHVCFIAHLDRWMQAEGVGLDGLGGPVIERYLARRRAAGYVEYRSLKALQPLLDYLAPLGVLPVRQEVPRCGGAAACSLSRLAARRAWRDAWDGARLRGLCAAVRRDPGAR